MGGMELIVFRVQWIMLNNRETACKKFSCWLARIAEGDGGGAQGFVFLWRFQRVGCPAVWLFTHLLSPIIIGVSFVSELYQGCRGIVDFKCEVELGAQRVGQMELGNGRAYLQEILLLTGQKSRESWRRDPGFHSIMEVLESGVFHHMTVHSSLMSFQYCNEAPILPPGFLPSGQLIP